MVRGALDRKVECDLHTVGVARRHEAPEIVEGPEVRMHSLVATFL